MTDHTQTDEKTPDVDDVGGAATPETAAASAADTAADEAAAGGAADAIEHGVDDAADDGDQLDPELRAAEDPRTPGQMLVALEEAEAQRDDFLDGLQRSRAEFENYRRRTTRETATARRAGVGDLAMTLLEALDDLDRTAEVAGSSDDEGLAAGIMAVHRKLRDALRAAGIRRVDGADVPFDANVHEAVQRVPAEEPLDEPEVAQVLRPGYVLDDRCLRAAMVVVRQ